jgi:16S rRNA (guanine527-N7)-methyltransferase
MPIMHPLNVLLTQEDSPPLTDTELARFDAYLALLLRWNARTNLTSIRTPEGILRRHFLESILAARALPTHLHTLLDFGSGAGFPGLPIALCRPALAVTLAESQHKKAAFLREAVRTLQLPVTVHSGRAQTLATPFDCVTLRAVDSMAESISAAIPLVTPGGWLALLTTHSQVASVQVAAAQLHTSSSRSNAASDSPPTHKSNYHIHWSDPIPLPSTDQQVLLLGQRVFA